ncbi:MAG: glycosyltransferase [Candidatus Daviesbacteria bacterium]|nr:glycosyltransferase [Candidatus Daviesbacteria bacterium]
MVALILIMDNGPLVSVIITTKNEEGVIGRLIQSIKTQTFKNQEIILVDNHSTDKTLDIAEKMNVKVYTVGPERSVQRNFGAKVAKGKYLLILDADMELTPNVISECVQLVESDKKAGEIVIPEKSLASNFWGKVKAFERSFYNKKGDELTDAARFFRKEVFFKAGGYDETITGPEDWDLPETIKELGYRVGRIKSEIYHYERINSPFSLASKKFYYARLAHRYLKKHNIPIISAKTIYFLRPVFYKNWRKILLHPGLSLAMFFMLALELIGGGLGYITGRIKKA